MGTVALSRQALAAVDHLEPMTISNPLFLYPNRDWEKTYRNLYQHDSSIVFLCAPNDTHDCLLRGFVKNGVVTRIAPTYGYSKAKDLNGNQASQRWDPPTYLPKNRVAISKRIQNMYMAGALRSNSL